MPVDLSLRTDLLFGIDLGDKCLYHKGRSKLDGAPGRGSGRYPLGSGENPYQHDLDFLSRVEKRKKELLEEGVPKSDLDKIIYKEMDMSSGKYRTELRIAKANKRLHDIPIARDMYYNQGMSRRAIAEILGYSGESMIRNMLNNEGYEARRSVGADTADKLKEALQKNVAIDVGEGVERVLGVSEQAKKEAIRRLEKEGYQVVDLAMSQPTNPHQRTKMKVIVNPDIDTGVNDDGQPLSVARYLYQNSDVIGSVESYSYNGESGFVKRHYPESIDASRVKIKYAEDGGTEKDGVIELRPGVDDLSMGSSNYAQVRILVNGTHYLKGMAVYNPDLPPGVDILFNTNKHEGTPMLGPDKKNSVLKPAVSKEVDKDNPFGAEFGADGQTYWDDEKGERHWSAVNKLKWEGDWDKQSNTLSQQFLSKQPVALIKQQLKLTYEGAEAEYNTIANLTNPTLRKKMLEDFGDQCDSSAVSLKAAALPRQHPRVLLPVPELKDNECYDPTYKTGERVVLIRYPHAGPFEIPELIVNNNNPAAKKALGRTSDAIGINHTVADRLSGADFDGDSVIVIPVNDKTRVVTKPPLKALEGFDPKAEYPERTGMKVMTKALTQKKMGEISNLITDMQLQGAPDDQLARAVKHSMVVIDAEKHVLDYTKSFEKNNIEGLRREWQRHIDPDTGEEKYGGASTLLSQRKQEVYIPERRGSGHIDKETGERIYQETHRTYIDKKTGKVVEAQDKIPKMMYYKDAYLLSTGTKEENAYADYANKMKALANKARKESVNMKPAAYNKEAAAEYKEEVKSINDKLDKAIMNSPRERRAVVIANARIKAKRDANPDMFEGSDNKKALKKLRKQEMDLAREEVGASGKKTRIVLTDREWDAIQSGAIHDSKAQKVFRYCDQDKLKERAMPKEMSVPAAKVNRIKSMANMGYDQSEIADRLGLSTSTVSKYIREEAE